MNEFNQFTALFLIFLIGSLLIQLLLFYRQVKHLQSHQNQVPARFQEKVSLLEHKKAIKYFFEKIKLKLLTILVDYALIIFLTVGGLVSFVVLKIPDFIQTQIFSTTGEHAPTYLFSVIDYINQSVLIPLIGSMMLVGFVAFLNLLINVPFSLYKQFVIEKKFDFNKMTLKTYFSDLIKTLLLAIFIGSPFFMGIIWLISEREVLGELWWVFLWVIVSIFTVGIQVIYPITIAPIFNKFTPLENGSLKTRLESLLDRCNFKSAGLFLMDGSRRSSHGNAFFAGLGKSRRIVLFDTLVEKLSDSEIEAVLAHELGHYKCGHIPRMMIMQLILSFLFFATFGYFIESSEFNLGLGIHQEISTISSAYGDTSFLIIFFLFINVILFPLEPITSMLSRKYEFEADKYAAKKSKPEDLISALVKLYRDNASPVTTDSWFSMFFDSHPPASLRIDALELKEVK